MIAQFLPYKSEIVIEKCIIAGITDTNPDMINRFRRTKFESLKEEEGGADIERHGMRHHSSSAIDNYP